MWGAHSVHRAGERSHAMQCARLGSFPGTVGPGGPQMGDRSELAVWGDGFGVYKLQLIMGIKKTGSQGLGTVS